MLLNGLPNECRGCSLCDNKYAGHFTKVTGRGTTGVMIIGEASGENEAQEARPFIEWGAAGAILEKAIKLGRGNREDFWITNILRCRPPNNILLGAEYERSAIDHCNQYLRREIENLRPRAILALGGIPTRELTGFSGGKRSVTYIRGYPLIGPSGITTIPSFHPAYTARGNTHLIPLLIKDLASARAAAAGRLLPVIDPSTLMETFTGVEAFRHLYEQARDNPTIPIAYDIETPQSSAGVDEDSLVEFEEGSGNDVYDSNDDLSEDIPTSKMPEGLDVNTTTIVSIQFAIAEDWGIYGDYSDEQIRHWSQRILELPNPKVAHNGNLFDRPILERFGIRFAGDHYDTLPMRKALQPDLPANLQQIAVDYGWRWPWKHFYGSDAILYGVADVCSLIMIFNKLPDEMKKLGIWQGFDRYIVQHREKVEIPWERRGIPMSRSRLDEMRDWLGAEVEDKTSRMLEKIPPSLHKREPTPQGFSNLPEEIKDFVYTRHPEVITPKPRFRKDGSPYLDAEGNQVYYKKEPYTVTQIYKMLLDGTLQGTLELVLSNYPDLRVMEDGSSLYRHVPFNPRSTQQMVSYIQYQAAKFPLGGYEVPKDFKKGTDSTADKLMKRLEVKTKDPVIALSREIRAYEKMRDSYTGKLKDGVIQGGWIPDSDGRLRTRAKTNSTWQFSSVDPNVFTLPKRRKELADRFRRCMAAEPGHVIIEFDYKAFHDLTTASLAFDERKWRTARIDPHAYVAGWLVKYPGIERALEMSDSDLKLYLKEIKSRHEKIRNEQAKPLNHGTNFGQGYRRLYQENEEYFESELQAKQMLDMLKTIYPKTFKWQEELLESLEITGGRNVPYLQTVWGARRWFWDVWSWKKNKYGAWYRSKGQDAEKALAFKPANHAHGMFRKKMLEMAELGILDLYELINFPHDALVFHPPTRLADECIAVVKSIMESPVIELANPILCPDGLVCTVDVQLGLDLGSMKELHL